MFAEHGAVKHPDRAVGDDALVEGMEKYLGVVTATLFNEPQGSCEQLTVADCVGIHWQWRVGRAKPTQPIQRIIGCTASVQPFCKGVESSVVRIELFLCACRHGVNRT